MTRLEESDITHCQVVRPGGRLAGLVLGEDRLPPAPARVAAALIPLLGRGERGGALRLEQVLVPDHGGLPVDGLVADPLVAQDGDAAPAPVVHLDVGPHLEEQHGVHDGHPGGAVHADVLGLDVDDHDGDGEHEEQVGHVEEHPQPPGQDVLGYQLLLEQDQEHRDICVESEVESGELSHVLNDHGFQLQCH